MTSDWRKAHETHVEVAKFAYTPQGQDVIAKGMWRFTGGAEEHGPHSLDSFREFATLLPTYLAHADTYWVSSDMGALAAKAVESMPGDVMLRSEDFISTEGFMVLQTPLDINSDQGQRVFEVKAISWTSRNPEMGVLFVGWTTHESLGRTLVEGDRAGESTLDWMARNNGSTGDPKVWFPVTSAIWASGKTYDEAFAIEGDESEFEGWYLDTAGIVAKALYTAVVLMGNRVARQERQHIARAQARRAQRLGLPMTDVVCITLRRELVGTTSEMDAVSEGGRVNWSHRWMVSGHWKPQWYPSLGEHRRIYIAPYVKGPTDKPLVVKDKVYAWTR